MADALNPPTTSAGGYIDTGLEWLGKAVNVYGDFEQARRADDIEYQQYDSTERAAAAGGIAGSSGLLIAAGIALAAFLVFRAMR